MNIKSIQQAVDEILSKVYDAELENRNVENIAIEEIEAKYKVKGLVDRLHSEGLATINNNSIFIEITDKGRQVQEQGGYIAWLNNKAMNDGSFKSLKFKDKKIKLLYALYEQRFKGFKDVQELLKPISVTWEEAYSLAQSLKNEGLAKMNAVKDTVYAEILPPGIELIDDEEFENNKYQPTDKFTDEEKEILKIKVDELGDKLRKLEFGQELIYNDLLEELKELKQLLEILGKKNWRQILQGKLIDAGLGELTSQAVNFITDTFPSDKLIN